MSRWLAIPAFVLVLAVCRRRDLAPDVPSAPPEPDVARSEAPAVPKGRCQLAGVSWVARPAPGERWTQDDGAVSPIDAGDALVSPIEAIAAAWDNDLHPWMAWIDARDHTLHLTRYGRRDVARFPLGAGNRSDLVLTVVGAARDTPLLAWSQDTLHGRHHTVRGGPSLSMGCEQPEGRDEVLQLTLAGTAEGALVAWDDVAPGAPGSVVMVQHLRISFGSERCSAPHQASPSNQDASDPVLVATPEGGAVLFWLEAHDPEVDRYNDTVTDLWGVPLDASGIAQGVPLRLSSTPAHRFGLSAAVAPDGHDVWLAYRVAPHGGTEARGDGGYVAVMRLTRGAASLGRSADATVVTLRDATPTGMPKVLARRHGAEVWWRERTADGVVTWHRSLDAQGRVSPSSPPLPERALHGQLPGWSDPLGTLVATIVRTPGGGVGLARYRCAP